MKGSPPVRFMNFSFGKKKEAPKVKARPNEGKESFVERVTRQAEEGDVNSQLTLGYMYLYGENGVSKDYEKAFRYYSMAAAQNDSIAVNISVQNGNVTVYPFVVQIDRYRAAVGGTQDLDMNFQAQLKK